jgi:hypothetical protein
MFAALLLASGFAFACACIATVVLGTSDPHGSGY